jgi:hypothetical protein
MKHLALVLCLSLPAMADVAPEKDVQAEAPAPAPQHPQGVEKVQMGVIEGGWAYVYAAYGAGLLGLIAYAASLYLRRPEAHEGPPPGAS